MKIEDIKQFATQQGYSDVTYLGQWEGFDIYEPLFGDPDEPVFVGLPFTIMVKGDTIRMSTPKEAMEQLKEGEKQWNLNR